MKVKLKNGTEVDLHDEDMKMIAEMYKDQIAADKIAQLRDEVMTLKNQAATAPLYGMIGGIQHTLNSVIGCAGVRVCNCNNTPPFQVQ